MSYIDQDYELLLTFAQDWVWEDDLKHAIRRETMRTSHQVTKFLKSLVYLRELEFENQCYRLTPLGKMFAFAYLATS